MNYFHFDGKISHISPASDKSYRGINITHYPTEIDDSFFEFGLVLPVEMFDKYDINLYDYIDLEGHYITLNRSLKPSKVKILHIVDNILKLEHE